MNTAADAQHPARDVVLAARDIVKTYGGTRALKGVNFEIHRGEVTTLFGRTAPGSRR